MGQSIVLKENTFDSKPSSMAQAVTMLIETIMKDGHVLMSKSFTELALEPWNLPWADFESESVLVYLTLVLVQR